MPAPRLYLAANSFTAALGGLLFGFDTAVISGTIPFITSYFELSDAMLGWAVSSALIGCVVGSVPAYYLGLYGGRPLVEKYGKYVLISHRDLDLADRWFERYGDWAIFFSRLLPVVRTFISFPAGVARMNFPRFVIYTFVGSFPWCLGLSYVGMKLGENWDTLGVYFHRFDIVIGILIALGVLYYVWHHLKGRKG